LIFTPGKGATTIMSMRFAFALTLSAMGCFALLGGCAAPADPSDAAIYSGFTRIDPETRARTENAWLVVRDGVIASAGAGTPPEGDFGAVHDVSGLYGMPGLIDAHAHVTIGPQEVTVVDGAPRVGMLSGDEYSRFNAAIALAFGVTTVRNPAGSTAANARYDAMVASGEWAGPEALHAGAIIQPPPFGGEYFAYPKTPEEWSAEAAAQAAAGMTYFKLYTDLTESELQEGVRAAKAHSLIPIAHLNTISWTRAMELGVEQLEHALPTSPDLLEPEARAAFTPNTPPNAFMYQWFELADFEGPLITDMVRTLAETRTTVDLTLVVNEITYNADQLGVIFPEAERVYLHPQSFASALTNLNALATIWKPEEFARARAVFPKVLSFARLLHDAGVPVMIGTDGTGGGPIYARELHNHALAGIPSWEVLRMATSGNATLMGLGQETGRLAPGMEADLVFLRADPTKDVRNVGEVALVVTNGEAHRFEDLVAMAETLVQ
jgi:imidazolonepropionase-like amidohydrolase